MTATTRSTVSSDQRWPATGRSQAHPIGEAARIKLALPGLPLAHQLDAAGQAQGHGH